MNNSQAFAQAQEYIPGGVNSPVRAFGAVGGTPPFIGSGKGAYLFDIEGRAYIDYVGSWGPMILGHADQRVIKAVNQQLDKGLSYGAPTLLETELAALIIKLMPSIEQIRFVNSGTEATMSAIRLARGFSGRDKIIKFIGCYHGHSDALLVDAGSGALTFGVPSSPGIPNDTTKNTLVLDFNDIEQLEESFKQHGNDLAAVIVEPVAGNMNLVPADASFLQRLRELCDHYKVVLIFDEVMSGFRVGIGGAQAHYKVKPDLTTLGKIIGGGMPVGAFGGRAEIMQQLSPAGKIYQAGTLSGNPMAMSAGIAQLQAVQAPDFYPQLNAKTKCLVDGLNQVAQQHGAEFHAKCIGSMFGLFFGHDKQVRNLAEVMACDLAQFKQFFHHMLSAGIYLAPSAFETGFVSAAHSDQDIKKRLKLPSSFLQGIINMAKFSLIVAYAQNRVIGRNNQLPWHLPDDLKHFKQLTLGKPVLMGRKTFDAIGKPLPGRRILVMSRDPKLELAGCEVVHSLDQLEHLVGDIEVMVAGGATIYQQCLPRAEKLYLTQIKANIVGNAYFPDLDFSRWRELSREHHDKDQRHNYAFDFVSFTAS